MKKTIITLASIAALAGATNAQTLVGGTHFTFTSVTPDPGPTGGTSFANTADGSFLNSIDAPTFAQRGVSYAWASGDPVSVATYTFSSLTNITNGFEIYNGLGSGPGSLDAFSLTFRDASGSQVGSTFTGNATVGVNDSSFFIGNYNGVKTVDLALLTGNAAGSGIEYREISFQGYAVPETFKRSDL